MPEGFGWTPPELREKEENTEPEAKEVEEKETKEVEYTKEEIAEI